MPLNWAETDEDEVMANIEKEIKARKKLEAYKIKVWNKILHKEYLDSIDEYSQIGLVLFMISQQKTINIYREGKEDREYNASLLMRNIQYFMEDEVPLGLWTPLLHSLCKDYIDKVKGNLIQRALNTHINVFNILLPKTLDKTISRNKKLYIERKGHPPPHPFDDSSDDS